jgi:hypothetical protein
MPTYEYRGLETGNVYEFFHSMKSPALETHPDTGEPIQRLISLPRIAIDSKKPKTIGSLAEKNTEMMLKRGDSRVAKKKNKRRPWWRAKDKVDTSLAKMSTRQKQKYILEGKK